MDIINQGLWGILFHKSEGKKCDNWLPYPLTRLIISRTHFYNIRSERNHFHNPPRHHFQCYMPQIQLMLHFSVNRLSGAFHIGSFGPWFTIFLFTINPLGFFLPYRRRYERDCFSFLIMEWTLMKGIVLSWLPLHRTNRALRDPVMTHSSGQHNCQGTDSSSHNAGRYPAANQEYLSGFPELFYSLTRYQRCNRSRHARTPSPEPSRQSHRAHKTHHGEPRGYDGCGRCCRNSRPGTFVPMVGMHGDDQR